MCDVQDDNTIYSKPNYPFRSNRPCYGSACNSVKLILNKAWSKILGSWQHQYDAILVSIQRSWDDKHTHTHTRDRQHSSSASLSLRGREGMCSCSTALLTAYSPLLFLNGGKVALPVGEAAGMKTSARGKGPGGVQPPSGHNDLTDSSVSQWERDCGVSMWKLNDRPGGSLRRNKNMPHHVEFRKPWVQRSNDTGIFPLGLWEALVTEQLSF